MSKLFFNPKNKGFYDTLFSTYIPEDANEITQVIYDEFAGVTWPNGKILGSDSFGMPVWVDAPPMTHEEEIAAAEEQKQALINQANVYMNGKQWPGKAAIGRLKGEELAQYNVWLDYLDGLEGLEPSLAPNIVWPELPQIAD